MRCLLPGALPVAVLRCMGVECALCARLFSRLPEKQVVVPITAPLLAKVNFGARLYLVACRAVQSIVSALDDYTSRYATLGNTERLLYTHIYMNDPVHQSLMMSDAAMSMVE